MSGEFWLVGGGGGVVLLGFRSFGKLQNKKSEAAGAERSCCFKGPGGRRRHRRQVAANAANVPVRLASGGIERSIKAELSGGIAAAVTAPSSAAGRHGDGGGGRACWEFVVICHGAAVGVWRSL